MILSICIRLNPIHFRTLGPILIENLLLRLLHEGFRDPSSAFNPQFIIEPGYCWPDVLESSDHVDGRCRHVGAVIRD